MKLVEMRIFTLSQICNWDAVVYQNPSHDKLLVLEPLHVPFSALLCQFLHLKLSMDDFHIDLDQVQTHRTRQLA